MKEAINYNKIETGMKVMVQWYNEKEIVTIGDKGKTYTDIIFETGDTKKVILQDILIEIL